MMMIIGLFIIIIIIIAYVIAHHLSKNIIDSILASLTVAIVLLTIVLVWQTNFIQELTYYDVPNYPYQGYEIITTETVNYIDTREGNSVIYEVDYLVKYSKLNPPKSYDVLIFLPMDTMKFIYVEESRGIEINSVRDRQNNTIIVQNKDYANPFLLHIIYASENAIYPKYIIKEIPMPYVKNNSVVNDSFFVRIENNDVYFIQNLEIHSNVTKWINDNLTYLKNVSWTNQTILIYDEDLPIKKTIIDDNGIVNWEINLLNPGEQKTYYFRKI
jgi:hypothetical protein